MEWAPKKCVLVPMDFSDPSREALRTGRKLVEEPSGLHVLHVLLPLHPAEPSPGDEARSVATMNVLKNEIGTELAGANLQVRFGSPGREIARYAAEIDADLIVMPTHGRSGLEGILIGSVAERVLRLAHCPILVIPARKAIGWN